MDEVRFRDFYVGKGTGVWVSGLKENAESLQKTEAHSYLDYEGVRELSGWSRDFCHFQYFSLTDREARNNFKFLKMFLFKSDDEVSLDQ